MATWGQPVPPFWNEIPGQQWLPGLVSTYQYAPTPAAVPSYQQLALFPQYTQLSLPYQQDVWKNLMAAVKGAKPGQMGPAPTPTAAKSQQQLIEQLFGQTPPGDEFRGQPIGSWPGSAFKPPAPLNVTESGTPYIVTGPPNPLAHPAFAIPNRQFPEWASPPDGSGGGLPIANLRSAQGDISPGLLPTAPSTAAGAGAPPISPPPYNWAGETAGAGGGGGGLPAVPAAGAGDIVDAGNAALATRLGLPAAGALTAMFGPKFINHLPGPQSAKDILGNTVAGAGWGSTGFALGPEVGIPTTVIGAGAGLGKGVLESIFG